MDCASGDVVGFAHIGNYNKVFKSVRLAHLSMICRQVVG